MGTVLPATSFVEISLYADPPVGDSASSLKSPVAPVFRQTASGYFVGTDVCSSDSSIVSDSPLMNLCVFFSWLKHTYLVPPWIYVWITLSLVFLFLWIGFVIVFFLLINGHYLPERSATELVE